MVFKTPRPCHHGRRARSLARIEDIDTPRCVAGTDTLILDQLAACGLHPDGPPLWQSQRAELYEAVLRHRAPAALA